MYSTIMMMTRKFSVLCNQTRKSFTPCLKIIITYQNLSNLNIKISVYYLRIYCILFDPNKLYSVINIINKRAGITKQKSKIFINVTTTNYIPKIQFTFY